MPNSDDERINEALITLVGALSARIVEVAANAYVQRIIERHQALRLPELMSKSAANLLPQLIPFPQLLRTAVESRKGHGHTLDVSLNFAVRAGRFAADIALATPAPPPTDIGDYFGLPPANAPADPFADAKAAAAAEMLAAVKRAREP